MRKIILAAAILGALAAGRADADLVVDFTYFGRNDIYGLTAYGTGNFTLVGTPTSASLSDVEAFSFDTRTIVVGSRQSPEYVYHLSDLLAFSATFNSSHALTTLSLVTAYVNATDPYNGYNHDRFFVTSLARDGALLQAGGVGPPFTVATGTVAIGGISVPEPTSIAMWGIATVAGLIASRARRPA